MLVSVWERTLHPGLLSPGTSQSRYSSGLSEGKRNKKMSAWRHGCGARADRRRPEATTTHRCSQRTQGPFGLNGSSGSVGAAVGEAVGRAVGGAVAGDSVVLLLLLLLPPLLGTALLLAAGSGGGSVSLARGRTVGEANGEKYRRRLPKRRVQTAQQPCLSRLMRLVLQTTQRPDLPPPVSCCWPQELVVGPSSVRQHAVCARRKEHVAPPLPAAPRPAASSPALPPAAAASIRGGEIDFCQPVQQDSVTRVC